MTVDFNHLYSERARNLIASDIREILKIMREPDLISFAGGMPNPDTFPISVIGEIAQTVLNDSIAESLQYGVTEGHMPLREALADRMRMRGVECEPENILVTSGAQQAIDLTSQLLLDPQACVLTESPTFVAALIGLRGYMVKIHSVSLDEEGIIVDILEEKLKGLHLAGIHPRMLYVIPNFQNPKGVTMSEPRRRKIVDLANEFDFIVLEDDPYYNLRFEGDQIPPIKAFDDSGRVIYASSFSKILSPGMRIGWIVSHRDIIRKITLLKQTSDVCTNVLSQCIAAEYLSKGHLDKQLPKIRELYHRKQKVMLSSLEEYFPSEARWTRPQGGMFLWVELPENIDTQQLQSKALERKVAFIHGSLFFPDGSGRNTMRLSYSHPTDDQIREGIRRLGEVIKEEMRAR